MTSFDKVSTWQFCFSDIFTAMASDFIWLHKIQSGQTLPLKILGLEREIDDYLVTVPYCTAFMEGFIRFWRKHSSAHSSLENLTAANPSCCSYALRSIK